MKIGILGIGYVGSAVAWTHRNHTLRKRDPKLGTESASLEEIKTCDAVYVCVPTPMLTNGHCDDSYVRSVLFDLNGFENTIICKSTIPPGVYKEIQEKYSNVVHVPEFLTAANATADYENSKWVLVGGENQWVDNAVHIISSSTIAAEKYHRTSIETASLFKYLCNCFLSTKVMFLNDMYALSNRLEIDWSEIKDFAKNDPRLGTSHWDVPGPDGKFGYGGACFPKDVSAIIEYAKSQNCRLELLESIQALNNKLRN